MSQTGVVSTSSPRQAFRKRFSLKAGLVSSPPRVSPRFASGRPAASSPRAGRLPRGRIPPPCVRGQTRPGRRLRARKPRSRRSPAARRRRSRLRLAALGLLGVVALRKPLLEVADTGPQRPAERRQAGRSEEKQDDPEDDQQFLSPEAKHRAPPWPIRRPDGLRTRNPASAQRLPLPAGCCADGRPIPTLPAVARAVAQREPKRGWVDEPRL